ncbi:glycoside hydrolase [Paenibacillus radicis (ex Gao et al. 2016)]|uniref:Glycoside hydrolase n=2 Tax=Paenibacillus radicis (ex Gao et al. 2016) TaxID=1737354 RepID=A0A917H022_9BACL|nr:glycoside hydrolase [Paenibacillus radicis (ex Gao et al. 2016)]
MINPPSKDRRKLINNQIEGINLLGYSRAEMGVGESCRLAANSLNAADIPFGILNFSGMNSSRKSDLSWVHKEITHPIYNINVFHINAEQIPEVNVKYGNILFDERYNIGYWHWELPDFPDEWLDSFNYLDEIWVPSTFVGDAIAMKSPIPVIKIPHSIEVKISDYRDRSYYKLPDKSFLFLTLYDVNSLQERKNPKASIEAFKLAFEPNDMCVGLVIKVNGSKSNQQESNKLFELISEYENIYIIEETLSRSDMNSLINVIDCFISLHRSEGFGLGFAEAMYLGIPVIGTNWSSNTDFMNEKNACLVDYKLVPLENDFGPYKSYQYWADPSAQHASEYMRKLVNDEDYRSSIASQGQAYIKEMHSPSAIGNLIRKRMNYIHKWKFGG